MDERRDDWQRAVDENRAALNTGQSDLYRSLRELRRLYAELNHLVNGNPGTHDPGFDARIEKIEESLRRLNGTMWPDPAGSKGLVAEFQELKHGRQDKRDLRGDLIKVVIAIITSGSIGLFWRDIRAFVLKKSTDPVDQMIEHAKHPKGKKLYRIRVISPEPEDPADD